MKTFKEKIKQEISGFQGQIGLAIEIEDGENIYFNSEELFQSASLIKIPILISVLMANKNGEIDLEQQITISQENKVGGSGVLQALSNHLSMTVKDLMTLMISVSDNTATNILIDLLGMDAINASMKEIGYEKTKLNRKMMDFSAIEEGKDNFTSPIEMIRSLELVNELNEVIGLTGMSIAYEALIHQQFRDKLPALMDIEKLTVLNKTGELPNVEHDCAIMDSQGRKAYVAVLMTRFVDQYSAKQTISRIGKHISDFLIRDQKNWIDQL
jgi:beta-lactamase class A